MQKLEVRSVISCLIWVLGMKPESSGRAEEERVIFITKSAHVTFQKPEGQDHLDGSSGKVLAA